MNSAIAQKQSARRTKTRRRSTLDRRRRLAAYSFLAPALLILGLFVVWPLLQSLWIALTDDTGFGDANFIGLDNYIAVVNDERFLNALGNTALYTLGTVPISIAIGLGLAVALNRRLPMRGFLRAAIFLPFISSMAIVSIAWVYLFDPRIGFVSSWLGVVGISLGDGIRDPNFAMTGVIIVGVWRNIGFFMVLYLAGLQGIPNEINEAAMMDGARAWQRFRLITWPLLANTTMFVGVIAIVSSLQVFDQVYVMTGGGPYFKTETVMMRILDLGVGRFEIGYSTAMAWVLGLLVLAVSLIQLGYFRRRAVQY